MTNRTHHPDLTADLEFYRSGFPLASLDRIRPAPRSGTIGRVRLFGRIAERFINAATGTDR